MAECSADLFGNIFERYLKYIWEIFGYILEIYFRDIEHSLSAVIQKRDAFDIGAIFILVLQVGLDRQSSNDRYMGDYVQMTGRAGLACKSLNPDPCPTDCSTYPPFLYAL